MKTTATVASGENHEVQRKMISVVNFFVFLRLLFFCFYVAICDLVHDVEAMYGCPCEQHLEIYLKNE